MPYHAWVVPAGVGTWLFFAFLVFALFFPFPSLRLVIPLPVIVVSEQKPFGRACCFTLFDLACIVTFLPPSFSRLSALVVAQESI